MEIQVQEVIKDIIAVEAGMAAPMTIERLPTTLPQLEGKLRLELIVIIYEFPHPIVLV